MNKTKECALSDIRSLFKLQKYHTCLSVEKEHAQACVNFIFFKLELISAPRFRYVVIENRGADESSYFDNILV